MSVSSHPHVAPSFVLLLCFYFTICYCLHWPSMGAMTKSGFQRTLVYFGDMQELLYIECLNNEKIIQEPCVN